MKQDLTPASYERLILNRWVRDIDNFAPAEAIDACCSLSYAPEPSDGTIAIGCDLGLTNDLAAVAAVERRGNEYELIDLHAWQGKPSRPVKIAEVEDRIRYLHDRMPHATIILDPWQMERTYQNFGLQMHVEKFNFNGNLTDLTRVLHRLVIENRIHWWPRAGYVRRYKSGRETTLTDEMKDLVIRDTAAGPRIDHKNSGTDDRCMALGMAVWYLAQEEALDAPELFTIRRGAPRDGWQPLTGPDPLLTGIL